MGDALRLAKLEYYQDADKLDSLHAKTLAGTVLYGLPMERVRVESGSSGQNLSSMEADQPQPSIHV